MEFFEYAFFRNAILGILFNSICAAIIGTYIISRRMVAITGGITHACFGGLGLGYFLGLNPVVTASVFLYFLHWELSGWQQSTVFAKTRQSL